MSSEEMGDSPGKPEHNPPFSLSALPLSPQPRPPTSGAGGHRVGLGTELGLDLNDSGLGRLETLGWPIQPPSVCIYKGHYNNGPLLLMTCSGWEWEPSPGGHLHPDSLGLCSAKALETQRPDMPGLHVRFPAS